MKFSIHPRKKYSSLCPLLYLPHKRDNLADSMFGDIYVVIKSYFTPSIEYTSTDLFN